MRTIDILSRLRILWWETVLYPPVRDFLVMRISFECPNSHLNITLEPFFVMFHNTAVFLHFFLKNYFWKQVYYSKTEWFVWWVEEGWDCSERVILHWERFCYFKYSISYCICLFFFFSCCNAWISCLTR